MKRFLITFVFLSENTLTWTVIAKTHSGALYIAMEELKDVFNVDEIKIISMEDITND